MERFDVGTTTNVPKTKVNVSTDIDWSFYVGCDRVDVCLIFMENRTVVGDVNAELRE